MQPIQIPSSFSFCPIKLTIPPPKEPAKTGPSLVQRIVAKIKKICNRLCFWRNDSPFNLSGKQIRLIRQATVDRKLQEEHTVKVIKEAKPKELPKPYQPRVQEEPTLAKLSTCLQDFADLLVNDCAKEEIIDPLLPGLKKSLQEIVSELKNWNSAFKEIRGHAAPLIQKLKKLDDPAITLVIQQLIHSTLQGEGNESEKKDIFREGLKIKLKKLKNDKVINQELHDKADDHIDPILNWLFHSNNWFLNSKQPVNLHHFISDSFRYLDALISTIDQDGLKDQLAEFKTFIENDLDDAVSELLEINTPLISEFISGRIADLIEHLPYTETYDELLQAIISQMEGWKAADKECDEQKNLIEDSRKAVRAHAANSVEVAKQSCAIKLLSIIDRDGGENAYLEKEFHRAFANHSACHSKISQWINATNDHERIKHLNELFNHLIDELIPHFLPKDKIQLPEGIHVDLCGITRIFSLIELPDSLKTLKKLVNELFETVLDKSDVQDKENFRNYFFVFGKIVISEVIHNRLKDEIANQLKNLFERLSNKDYIDYLFSKNILPILIDKIFEGYVRALIERKSAIVTVHFHAMVEGEIDICAIEKDLLDYLYGIVQQSLIDFSMDDTGITKEHFNELIEPVISEIYHYIKKVKEEKPTRRLSEQNVKSILNKYFEAEVVPVNHDYGKLIMNALFGIANFGGSFTQKIVGWFQGSLSANTSQTLHLARKDYHLVINSVVESINNNLLDSNTLKKIFFQPEPSKKELKERAKQVKENLPKQLRSIAAIAHDSIYRSIESKGIPFIKSFTPSTGTLEDVIGNVFNRLLKREGLNINLLVACTEIIQKRLRQSVTELNAQLEIDERSGLLI